MSKRLAQLELEEEIAALELTLKRCEKALVINEEERERIDKNTAATRDALAERRTQLAVLVKEGNPHG